MSYKNPQKTKLISSQACPKQEGSETTESREKRVGYIASDWQWKREEAFKSMI